MAKNTKSGKTWWREYLNSDWWRIRKAHFLETFGGKCRYCKTTDGVGVYHRHYNSLWKEKDNDLETCCHLCWREKNHHSISPDLDRQFREKVNDGT